jgi:hypothetical protein
MKRIALMLVVTLAGCAGRAEDPDARFAEVQARGRLAMGVDQYSSTHVFESLPDGGRIELQRDSADTAGTAVIRAHMEDIREAFTAGDFRIPGFVHDMQAVPGTTEMAAKRELIRYEVRPLPRGAELRMATSDTAAIRAIHEFLAFQRMDHRAHH